jgi:hypothetical protein
MLNGWFDIVKRRGIKDIGPVFPQRYENIITQVKRDIQLHRIAINRGRDERGTLEANIPIKEKVIDILQGKERNVDIINGIIESLSESQDVHRLYLREEAPPGVTGYRANYYNQPEWHEFWIDAYDNWISVLEEIIERLHE